MADEQKPSIKTKMIIEIAGCPKEHVDEALRKTAENFGKESKKVTITSKKIGIAQKVKIEKIENTEMFSGFVEVEFAAETLSTIVGLIFDWMPSSVEVIAPEKISDDTTEINHVLNDLTGRLHQYDSVVKRQKARMVLLARELAKYKPPEEPTDKEKP